MMKLIERCSTLTTDEGGSLHSEGHTVFGWNGILQITLVTQICIYERVRRAGVNFSAEQVAVV